MGLFRGRALAWAEAKDSLSALSLLKLCLICMIMQVISLSGCSRFTKAWTRGWTIRSGSGHWLLRWGWNEEALQWIFFWGLHKNLTDELAARDAPTDLDSLIALYFN